MVSLYTNAARAEGHFQSKAALQHASAKFPVEFHPSAAGGSRRSAAFHTTCSCGSSSSRVRRASKGIVGGSSFRQLHPVVQHRFQHRLAGIRLYAKALSGIGFCGAQHRADGARRGFADQAVFAAGDRPAAGRPFLHNLHTGIWARTTRLDLTFSTPSGHLQVGHARARIRLPAILKMRCAKAAAIWPACGYPAADH